MWWRFRKRYGNAPKESERVDPWLYAKADEPSERRSIARDFFVAFYGRAGDGVGRYDLEAVASIDTTKLRPAGEVAGRKIFYEGSF